MKIKKKVDERVHNLLMSSKVEKPLYSYKKDGIYIMFGPWSGRNISNLYLDNADMVLDYLYSILDYDNVPYKMRFITNNIIKDLLDKN